MITVSQRFRKITHNSEIYEIILVVYFNTIVNKSQRMAIKNKYIIFLTVRKLRPFLLNSKNKSSFKDNINFEL